MNVAFFIPSISNKGGVERATISLLNALADTADNEVNIYLIVFKDRPIFDLDERIKVHTLEITSYKKEYIQVVMKLRSLIIKNKLDIIVSIETMSLLFTLLPTLMLLEKPKLVVWEHFNFKNNNGRSSRQWLRWIAAKKTDLIVTLTERDAKTWKSTIRLKSKITHIFNITPFNNEEASYDLNSKTAIAIGRYVPVKGFDRLIEAWSLFEKNYGNNEWLLKIVGYGELAERLNDKIKSLNINSIELILDQDNIEDIYKSAGIYCMSSYSEGLPMVLIEAQSFGIPSIAFDIYTGPKEILRYGSGLLVEDNHLNDYASAIYKLTSNPTLRREMNKAALNNNKRFKSETIARQWLTELRNLLK